MRNIVHNSAKTKICCIIGHPISHSFSPFIHNFWFQDLGLDFLYIAFDVLKNQLKQAIKGIKALNICGFNVTIPHKENILALLDKVDPLAQDIGAINTVKNENGILIGRNTDAMGAKKALLDAGCKIKNKNIIVLGAGGAARAVCHSLINDVDRIVIANRTIERGRALSKSLTNKKLVEVEAIHNDPQSLMKRITNIDILINTTPVGMYPQLNQSPILRDILHSELFVFDLVYNPLETQLLKDATTIGCKTLSGLDMLINQGAMAFEWWTGKKPKFNLMKNEIVEYFGMK